MRHIEGNFKGVRNVNIYYQGWLFTPFPRDARPEIRGKSPLQLGGTT